MVLGVLRKCKIFEDTRNEKGKRLGESEKGKMPRPLVKGGSSAVRRCLG